jgi:hypothetical protein
MCGVMLKKEGGSCKVIAQYIIKRYYIRDSETNELWCFDADFYSKKTALA